MSREARTGGPGAEGAIDPPTRMGRVELTVRDLDRAVSFYQGALGLSATVGDDGSVTLAAPGGAQLVTLYGEPDARALQRRAPGLYHLAILLPSRRDLAAALVRLASARWPLDGASDHLVSEALYLSDPEGNGIELYCDRPRDQWPSADGQLRMATLALDLEGLLGELRGDRRAGEPDSGRRLGEVAAQVPPQTRIGHVHLQVSELAATERFYAGALGFDVTVRSYPGALFVSAGGYHHHLGLNTWHSAGAGPAPAGSVGLRRFEVLFGDEAALASTLERARAAGLRPETLDDGGALLRDPSGNALVLRVAGDPRATTGRPNSPQEATTGIEPV
jgi:catechol 2,3-dioxygenase